MAILIKGLHIEEIIIDAEPEEEQPEPVQEEPKKADPVKTAPKKTKRKAIDKGKIGALYKAGWSVAKIADEMRCSQTAVYNALKELGL